MEATANLFLGPDPLAARRRALAVAQGREPADLVIRDCTVVNVYTGTLLPHRHVGTAGPLIAYVTPEEMPVGPDTLVLDGSGKYVVPGFIDAHAHLDEGVLTVPEFLRYGMVGGTTAFITDAMEAANAMGFAGVTWFLESCREQPVHIFPLAPTMVPGDPTLVIGHSLGRADVEELLRRPEVVGLGESYWTQLLTNPERLLPLFVLAEDCRKTVEGHGAGARGLRLGALAASGAAACHEAISVAEVEERLALGIFTILREGSIRRDLQALAPLAGRDLDFRLLGLGTDGVDPPELLRQGAMEYVVQRAIDLGFDPIKAIQMATINNATHFHLDRYLGGVAPGRLADLVLLPDLRNIKAEAVVARGRLLAREGRLLVQPRPYTYPATARTILRYDRRFSPKDLEPAPPPGCPRVTARVIHQRDDVVTEAASFELELTGGELRLPPGINLAVAVSTLDPAVYSLGFVSGWNLKAGACASSATWDAPHIAGVGATAAELARAVNRVAELGGGVVVCRGQEVLAELPLPIGGIISDLPAEEVATRMERATAALRELGYPYENPLLALRVLAFVGVPRLRLSAKGLINVHSRGPELVSLFV